jgi:hypothetical protein
MEDWCVSSATHIIYIQNKLLGVKVVVTTLFEFTLLFVEKRDKEYENEGYNVKEKAVFDYILGVRGGKELYKYNVSK